MAAVHPAGPEPMMTTFSDIMTALSSAINDRCDRLILGCAESRSDFKVLAASFNGARVAVSARSAGWCRTLSRWRQPALAVPPKKVTAHNGHYQKHNACPADPAF